MSMPGMDTMDMELLQACLDACAACEQACTVCSTQMLSCAPACMNCADMCNTMMRPMLRMQGMTPAATMAMLDACIAMRSVEHTSQLQSLMRISYAVFCLQQPPQSTISSHTL